MLFSLLEKFQVLTETHFVAIHGIGIQPDSILGKFGIVELGPQSVGIVVDALAAEYKLAGGD
jgi:hypothetical protein